MRRSESVPMVKLAPIVEKWLAERDVDARAYQRSRGHRGSGSGAIAYLSELSGIPARRIYAIRRGWNDDGQGGRYYSVTHQTADKLLCAVDRPDAWHLELAA